MLLLPKLSSFMFLAFAFLLAELVERFLSFAWSLHLQAVMGAPKTCPHAQKYLQTLFRMAWVLWRHVGKSLGPRIGSPEISLRTQHTLAKPVLVWHLVNRPPQGGDRVTKGLGAGRLLKAPSNFPRNQNQHPPSDLSLSSKESKVVRSQTKKRAQLNVASVNILLCC